MPELKCSKCGETASGPGAKDALARHAKKKHSPFRKIVKK